MGFIFLKISTSKWNCLTLVQELLKGQFNFLTIELKYFWNSGVSYSFDEYVIPEISWLMERATSIHIDK